MLHDADNSFGLGVYRAYYSASDAGFGSPDCPHTECGGGSATLLANSSDGLVWSKPDLGLFNWTGSGVRSGVHGCHSCYDMERRRNNCSLDAAGQRQRPRARVPACLVAHGEISSAPAASALCWTRLPAA